MGDKINLAEKSEQSLDDIIPKEKPKPAVRYNSDFLKQYNADMSNMSRKQLVEYAEALEKKCNKSNKILAKKDDMIIASSQVKYRQGVSKLSEREDIYFEKNHRHAYKVLFGLAERFDSYQDFKRAIFNRGAFDFAMSIRAINDSDLEEPYGLSGMEPACPCCQHNDFLDEEN